MPTRLLMRREGCSFRAMQVLLRLPIGRADAAELTGPTGWLRWLLEGTSRSGPPWPCFEPYPYPYIYIYISVLFQCRLQGFKGSGQARNQCFLHLPTVTPQVPGDMSNADEDVKKGLAEDLVFNLGTCSFPSLDQSYADKLLLQ